MTDKLLLSDINKHDCFVGFSRRSISLDTPTDILSTMLSIGSGETSYFLYKMNIKIPFTGIFNADSMGKAIKYRINEVDVYKQPKSLILGVENVYVNYADHFETDLHEKYMYTTFDVYTLNPLYDILGSLPLRKVDDHYFSCDDVEQIINLLLGIQIK